MGDMLSDAIGCVGFSWAASPACTELEIVVLDWLVSMLGLPKTFKHDTGVGGGVLQSSASDCILVTMLAARHNAIEKEKERNPEIEPCSVLSKLVGYCSVLAHSAVEKAGMLSFVKIRQLDVDENYSLRGETLKIAIEEDLSEGLIPFYACTTLGTTACCSFDNLEEMGRVCKQYNVWLHADGAYAGSAFVCPEFRHYLTGVEKVSSLNFNPNKWMLTNFDCSVLWMQDRNLLTNSMIVDPVYLQHHHSSKAVDFRHWGIPLSRRFRSLKLWFVIRHYGVDGIQKYIREHIRLAKMFESLLVTDSRFEIIGKATLGLVCFRLKGLNSLTQCLIRTINESGEIHVVPAVVKELYIIRFAICAEYAKDDDVHFAWGVIRSFADEILASSSSFHIWKERTVHKRKGYTLPIQQQEDEANYDEKDTSSGEESVLEERGEYEDEEDEENDEVFVCEHDLGVGLPRDSNLRRNTLLKMISDPAFYNCNVRRSLCFCGNSISKSSRLRSTSHRKTNHFGTNGLEEKEKSSSMSEKNNI